MKKISIIISLYNEESSISPFWQTLNTELKKIKNFSFEVIFVNDGSIDKTASILSKLASSHSKIKVINLSTNFGHEAAMIAGIDYAKGDAVICMDGDLQHPPSKIKEMLNKYSQGNHVINMVRKNNKDANIYRILSTSAFYFLINKVSHAHFEPNASDFFLLSRKAAHILQKNYRERNRFIRGLTQLIGLKSTVLYFNADRRVQGKSKYSFKKLISLSVHAFMAFSNLPLHLSLVFGIMMGILSFVVGIYSVVMKLLGAVTPGYTTIVTLISFLFSIQFILIGIIGEYVGFLYTESKQRPIYIVDTLLNFKK